MRLISHALLWMFAVRLARAFVREKLNAGHVVRLSAAGLAQQATSEPSRWREQWAEVKKIRELNKGTAPVDSLGATALAYSKIGSELVPVGGKSFRFRTLIATMLSPQTKDQQTGEAYEALVQLVVETVKGGAEFTSETFAKLSLTEIEQACRPVSFYKTKAKNILDAAKRMNSDFGGDLPKEIEDLLDFRGVGPKIGYLTFEIAWQKSEGICVDTHVHRISNRLQFVDTDPIHRSRSGKHKGGDAVKPVSNGPEKTRKALQEFLPKEYWGEINELFVGFGQTVCSARSPLCDEACSEVLRRSCLYYQDKGGGGIE